MATKKKPVAKVTSKKALPGGAKKAITKTAPQKASRVGTKYACSDCGLIVTVDQDCGCSIVDLVCCGTPMKKKRPPAKK